MIAPSARPPHFQPAALLAVAAGGVVGTGTRYLLETAFPARAGEWPWTTFAINMTGAALLGLLGAILVARADDSAARTRLRLFATTGCCGAFTTYSTFALEQVNLVRYDAVLVAFGYAIVSVGVGVLAAWLGYELGIRVAAGQRR